MNKIFEGIILANSGKDGYSGSDGELLQIYSFSGGLTPRYRISHVTGDTGMQDGTLFTLRGERVYLLPHD